MKEGYNPLCGSTESSFSEIKTVRLLQFLCF
jgi:hypothetical protein